MAGYTLAGSPSLGAITSGCKDNIAPLVDSSIAWSRELYDSGFFGELAFSIPVYGSSQKSTDAFASGSYITGTSELCWAVIEMFTLGAGSEVTQGIKTIGSSIKTGYQSFRLGKELTNSQLVQKSATLAERAIGGTGGVAGTAKHQYASKLLNRYQSIYGNRGLETGLYFNKGVGNRGFLDVIDYTNGVIYDFKFGKSELDSLQLSNRTVRMKVCLKNNRVEIKGKALTVFEAKMRI